MKFWRSELGLGLGVGTFKAWDELGVDIGRFTITSSILEKVEGFDLRMGDLVDWASYRLCGGMSNLAPTSIKPASGVRKVVDVNRVFLEWSHLALNKKMDENEDPEFTREDDDFVTPVTKKKSVVKGLQKKKDKEGAEEEGVPKKTKRVCDEKEKEEGKRKGLARVRAAKRQRKEGGADKNMELAMALSVSEEAERQREEELRQERSKEERREDQQREEERRDDQLREEERREEEHREEERREEEQREKEQREEEQRENKRREDQLREDEQRVEELREAEQWEEEQREGEQSEGGRMVEERRLSMPTVSPSPRQPRQPRKQLPSKQNKVRIILNSKLDFLKSSYNYL